MAKEPEVIIEETGSIPKEELMEEPKKVTIQALVAGCINELNEFVYKGEEVQKFGMPIQTKIIPRLFLCIDAMNEFDKKMADLMKENGGAEDGNPDAE